MPVPVPVNLVCSSPFLGQPCRGLERRSAARREARPADGARLRPARRLPDQPDRLARPRRLLQRGQQRGAPERRRRGAGGCGRGRLHPDARGAAAGMAGEGAGAAGRPALHPCMGSAGRVGWPHAVSDHNKCLSPGMVCRLAAIRIGSPRVCASYGTACAVHDVASAAGPQQAYACRST